MDKLNKKKKLLTVEDLVKFCESNQLNTFSSKESGYELCVHVPATFKKKEVETKDDTLLYCILKTCHIGLNRNGSFISEESMKEAMPTLKYKPILCNFTETEDGLDFTSHDMEIDDSGNVTYIERQVGCFTADEPYLEYDEEHDKTYVMAYAAIPREYTEAADIIERKDGTKVSVELNINEMSFNAKEKYLQLDSFVFSGCTLLGVNPNTGKEVGEGMEGSRLDIADFSQENNSMMNYSENNKEINNKLIETLEALNNTLSKFNINKEDLKSSEIYGKEENGSMNEEIKVEEEVTEVDTVEETTETVEEFTEETVEEVAEETVEETAEEVTETEEFTEEVAETETDEAVEEGTPEVGEEFEESEEIEEVENVDENVESYSSVVKYSIESKGEIKTYEISLDEKIYAIQDLVNLTYGESDNTYYGVKVYEDHVIMLDYWSGRAYKQSYSEENDSYVLTGDRIEVYSVWVTKEEEESLNEMRENYSSISEELSKYHKAEIDSQKAEILADEAYAEFADTEEFKSINENIENYSVDELKTACELAFAKCVKKNGSFSLRTNEEKTEKKKNKIGINATFEESDDNEPYGDYFKSLEN